MNDATFPPPPPGPPGPPPGFPPQAPLPPVPVSPQSGRSKLTKRLALGTGGVLLTAAAVGGGIWAYSEFFGQGPQAAEALPSDDLLGYVGIDLDPSGKQKVEAVETLNKFPAFKDKVDIKADENLLEKAFEFAQDEDDDFCPEIDFADDVDPWLGDRFGFAVYDSGDVMDPTFVGVVRIEDVDAAEKGIEKFLACAEEDAGEEIGGYAISGDWAIIAETEKIAEDIAEKGEESPLSEDEDFERWTDETGDHGIVTMYAAPAAAEAVLDAMEADDVEIGDKTREAVEKFDGAGGVIRFDDGALEAEFATTVLPAEMKDLTSDAGAEAVGSLPESTAVALGFGLKQGWLDTVLDFYGEDIEAESGMSLEEAIEEFESETGLSVPEDVETLTGESIAIVVDGDIDPDAFSSFDYQNIPIGLKVKGDADKIEELVDDLRERAIADGAPADIVSSKVDGDYVLISSSEDYLDKLADEDGLADTDLFEQVVPEDGDASSVFFINFDAGSKKGWLYDLVKSVAGIFMDEDSEELEEVLENIEPLEGLGGSSWIDGDVAHSRLTLTTED